MGISPWISPRPPMALWLSRFEMELAIFSLNLLSSPLFVLGALEAEMTKKSVAPWKLQHSSIGEGKDLFSGWEDVQQSTAAKMAASPAPLSEGLHCQLQGLSVPNNSAPKPHSAVCWVSQTQDVQNLPHPRPLLNYCFTTSKAGTNIYPQPSRLDLWRPFLIPLFSTIASH